MHSTETGHITVRENPTCFVIYSGTDIKWCEGAFCIDDTIPFQPTEASVMAKVKTVYGYKASKCTSLYKSFK